MDLIPLDSVYLDDQRVLKASRIVAKDSFTENRNLDIGGVEAGEAIEHAKGVAQILRENVEQGKQKEATEHRNPLIF